jgi:hypothetical protein
MNFGFGKPTAAKVPAVSFGFGTAGAAAAAPVSTAAVATKSFVADNASGFLKACPSCGVKIAHGELRIGPNEEKDGNRAPAFHHFTCFRDTWLPAHPERAITDIAAVDVRPGVTIEDQKRIQALVGASRGKTARPEEAEATSSTKKHREDRGGLAGAAEDVAESLRLSTSGDKAKAWETLQLAVKDITAAGDALFRIATAEQVPGLVELLGPEVAVVEMQRKVYSASPLRYAVRELNMDKVRSLLRSGCPVEPTSLHDAAEASRQGRKDPNVNKVVIDIIDLVLAAGGNQHLHAFDLNNYTPLHHAAWAGNLDVIRKLVAVGADVNCRAPLKPPYQGLADAAVTAAAGEGHAEALQLLISLGATIAGVEDANGLSVEQHARKHGFLEAAEVAKRQQTS